MSYTRTLSAFKKAVRIARKEVDDEVILEKVLRKYVEVEEVLNGQTRDNSFALPSTEQGTSRGCIPVNS